MNKIIVSEIGKEDVIVLRNENVTISNDEVEVKTFTVTSSIESIKHTIFMTDEVFEKSKYYG